MRGPTLFYFDFVVFPILATIMFITYCRDWGFIEISILGFFLFTFVEYWVHRTVLHRLFYHGVHERHHDHPEEYVVFPIWYTPLIFLVFWAIMPVALFSGFVVGFCWFVYWHHILHHFDLSKLVIIRRYALWHLAHHKLDYCNYGITVPVWDFVFGTYRSAYGK